MLPYDLDVVRRAPGMYLRNQEFDTAVAYIDGLDAASCNSMLLGLQEWLVPTLGTGANLVWSELILHITFPNAADVRAELLLPCGHETAIESMFALLEEFWRERSAPSGMRRIFLRFQNWLDRQPWYDPDSPEWIDVTDFRYGPESGEPESRVKEARRNADG